MVPPYASSLVLVGMTREASAAHASALTRDQGKDFIPMTRFRFLTFVLCALTVLAARPAAAVPSFADQTGLPCNQCHVGAFGPQLKPFGRQFKLNGYTLSDGTDRLLPPLSAMVETSFTHTEAPQAGGAAPHFASNDNFAVDQTSLFLAGRFADNFGGFIQVTYDGVARQFVWDQTDLRYANSTELGGHGLIYGATFNNNPTVQDPWNTTPAWGFPFAASALAPTPGAATLIDGGLAQTSVGGGVYADWNDLLYLELDAYGDLGNTLRRSFGVPVTGQSRIDGAAPYWRVALHQDLGVHNVEIGTYGISANVFPSGVTQFNTDHFTDVAIDGQYQFIPNDNWDFSAYATWIHENQRLSASQPLLGANASNVLETFRSNVSLTWQDTVTANLQYFDTIGSTDAAFFATASGSPNSAGWITELDYTPNGKPEGSYLPPWLNLKLAAQYVSYNKFDGTSTGASANNTAYLLAWWTVPLL